MKKQLLAVIVMLLPLVLYSTGASASVVEQLHETFASGATFTGQVTFTDAFDNILAVNGTLTGSSFGPSPDRITWVWWTASETNGSGVYSNFLMDGTGTSSSNYLTYQQFIEINWSAAPLKLVNTGPITYLPNSINYSDQMTSYAFSSVPLPGALLLFGPGLAGLALVRRRSKK